MKNKLVILLVLTIFFLPAFSNAATIFSDNFETYPFGGLGHQGGWISDISYATIQNYNVLHGQKSLKICGQYVYPAVAQRSGVSMLDGQITLYFYRTFGGNSSAFPEVTIELKQGDIVVSSVKAQSVFKYYSKASQQYVNFFPYYVSTEGLVAFQMQWRSSDHKVKYIIHGRDNVQTDWLPAMADWTAGIDTLVIKSRDGCTVFDSIQENLIPDKTPVLIVPGLVGTEMKKGDELLWADITRMINPFNDDSFMDPIKFNADLSPSDISVYNDEVIKKKIITVGQNEITVLDYTNELINEFGGQGYAEGEMLFTFPYDWRYGVSGARADGKTNVDLLAEKIGEILDATGAGKVDVVAHSMGGLIVKKYVQENPGSHNIGKAVFVGVPNTGAPESVKVLLQGDNLGVMGLNDEEIKKIAENMPAVYDLLSSKKYYDAKGSFIKTVDFNVGESLFEEKDLNYEESKDFLINGHSLNSVAMTNAENLHTQSFDDYDLRTAGVDLYAINGCKAGTLAKIIEETRANFFGGTRVEYQRPQLSPGDGTVPLESATNLPIDQENKFYALAADHGKMMSQDGIRQKIVNILAGSNLDVSSSLITQDIGQCQLNGRAISVFSPVDIFVTDQNGNKLGLAEDGSVINEVPNADFEIWGERKFVYLPTDNGQTYSINLEGTASGEFTIKSQNIVNGEGADTEIFSNLPVTAGLTGQVNLSGGATTLLVGGETILPTVILTAEQSEDLIPPITTATLSGTAGQPNFYRSDVSINLKATDNLSGVLYVEYNLDNAGYQKIFSGTAEISVLNEGNHAITFFATDKAGNNEIEQTINFTTDKTAPEALIEFDPDIKDLKFTGIDETHVSIIDNDNVIILADQAGNTAEINFISKNRKLIKRAEIKSIKYNGVTADKRGVIMTTFWIYDWKGKLTTLSQYVLSKNAYNVLAIYSGKNTVVISKNSFLPTYKIWPGMIIVKVTTSKGDLLWTY